MIPTYRNGAWPTAPSQPKDETKRNLGHTFSQLSLSANATNSSSPEQMTELNVSSSSFFNVLSFNLPPITKKSIPDLLTVEDAHKWNLAQQKVQDRTTKFEPLNQETRGYSEESCNFICQGC